MDRSLDNSRLNGSDTEDMVNEYVTDFENSTDVLKEKFNARDSVGGDVEDVFNRASFINSFMARNRLTTAAQNSWNLIRTDLNTLARYYSVSWDWRNPVQTPVSNRAYRVSDTQVQSLLASIETKTDTFKRTIDRSLDRSR